MLLICTHAEMLHVCTLRSLYSPLLRVKNDQLYDYNDYFTLRAFSVFRLQRKTGSARVAIHSQNTHNKARIDARINVRQHVHRTGDVTGKSDKSK